MFVKVVQNDFMRFVTWMRAIKRIWCTEFCEQLNSQTHAHEYLFFQIESSFHTTVLSYGKSDPLLILSDEGTISSDKYVL